MSAVIQKLHLTVEEYLKQELTHEIKHELVDGYVYAMAGTSANHERISVNVLIKFGNHLENSSCEPFGSDMKLKVNSNFFYPDVMVDCKFDNSEPYFATTPVIIIESSWSSSSKTSENDLRVIKTSEIIGAICPPILRHIPTLSLTFYIDSSLISEI